MINEKQQRAKYVIADYLSTNLAFFLFNIVRFHLFKHVIDPSVSSFGTFVTSNTVILEQIFFPFAMLGVYSLSGFYKNVFVRSRVQEFFNTATTALIGTLALYLFVLANDMAPRRTFVIEVILSLFFILFICLYLPRFLITSASAKKIESGRWGFDTLIIGTSQAARNFEKRLRSTRNKTGLRIVGFVDTGNTAEGHITTDGGIDLPVHNISDLEEICRNSGIKCLVVVPHRHGMKATTDLINRLFPLELPVYITPDVFQLLTARPRMLNIASELLIDITSCGMADSTATLKRFSDIVVSALTLVCLLPLFGVLAILIKRDSPGPVFYRQQRIGHHKKPFTIYKFRSMYVDAESAGPALSTIEDPRVTRLGRFLRKYRLDELPQFWNVLKGEMSLVGPRPEREHYIKQIVEKAPHYTIIHQVRPGITSWGMVKYGYASTVEEMIERLPYDLLYIENVSFIVDIKIIIYTIRTVVTGRGI